MDSASTSPLLRRIAFSVVCLSTLDMASVSCQLWCSPPGVLKFASPKARVLYMKKRNPRMIRWTVTYRRINKEMVTADQIRKRAKKVRKAQRPIIGADLESIRQKKAQKETIRIASREAALKELQDRKTKRQEAAKKTAKAPQSAPKQKVVQPKMPKQKMQGPVGRLAV